MQGEVQGLQAEARGDAQEGLGMPQGSVLGVREVWGWEAAPGGCVFGVTHSERWGW